VVTARRSSKLTKLLFLTAFASPMLGCGRSGSGDTPGVTAEANRLIGSWDARFYLGGMLRARSTAPGDVRGTLLFARIRSASPTFPNMAAPLNYGLYDVDFSPYGFNLRENGFLPGVVASAVPTRARGIDSVFIVLEPEQRGISVSIRGELRGDQADGVWTAESPSRAGIAESGRFMMMRKSHGTDVISR
jgi:hypothetical protein